MPAGDIELIETGTVADSSAQNQPDYQTTANAKALGIKRRKLLKAMLVCATLIALVSLLAVAVGIVSFLTSGNDVPYSLGGCAFAGGMALLFTICPFCLYLEGKKTKTDTRMTPTFRCCLIGLVVWFAFSMCVILMAMGLSGIWGIVECLKIKRNPESDFLTTCKDQTDIKFVFSVLSLTLSSLLLILSLVIVCIFCNNTEAFGYETIQQRNYKYYRSHFREEFEREQLAQNDQWIHQNREFRDESPIVPSAPPLDVIGDNRDQRPHHGRNHPRDNDGQRNRPHGPRPESEQRRRDKRDREKGNDTEAPPPSYDEVVDKTLISES